MIVANAVIGDIFSSNGDNDDSDNVHSKDKMGSTLGIQAATISLGFLFGSLAGGRLIEHGERAAYGCALIFSALATLNVGLRMMDSLELAPSTTHSHTWNWSLLRRKVLEAPLSSIQLLVHYGPRSKW